jgi:RNA polymerase sigma-70 factor, ECF subfamily
MIDGRRDGGHQVWRETAGDRVIVPRSGCPGRRATGRGTTGRGIPGKLVRLWLPASMESEDLVSQPPKGTSELDRHFDDLYAELRAAAARSLRSERDGHTLRPTALVHEAYLRLSAHRGRWESHEQFVAAAAGAMRRILVDHARRRGAARRGEGQRPVTLTAGSAASGPLEIDVLALHHALHELAAVDERSARVVELRFFGGLTTGKAARVLEISAASVKRDWAFAKAWLLRRLESIEREVDDAP